MTDSAHRFILLVSEHPHSVHHVERLDPVDVEVHDRRQRRRPETATATARRQGEHPPAVLSRPRGMVAAPAQPVVLAQRQPRAAAGRQLLALALVARAALPPREHVLQHRTVFSGERGRAQRRR
jgi:hypothetical protein